MANTFTNAVDLGYVVNTGQFTVSYVVGSGLNRLLVVGVQGDVTNDYITGVTYNGVAMSLIDPINGKNYVAGAGNARWEYMYYLLNPASGTHNIVISASASCDYIIAGAADYAGVAQVAPETTAKHIINPGTSLTTPITTITDNAWAILFENGYNGGPAPGAGTGDVSRITSGGWGLFDSGGAITPAGVYNMTTTRTSSVAIVHFIAAFAPFGGAYAYGFNMPMGGL